MSRVGSPFTAIKISQQTLPNESSIGEMKNGGVAARGLTQNFERSEAVFVHEQFHLERVLAMRENADVAAHGESHAGFARRFHARAFLLDARRLRIDAFFPAVITRDRIAGRDGRTKRDAFLFHQTKHFRRAFIAVLDRFDAGIDRAAHSFRGRGVRSGRSTGGARGLHDRVQFVLRKCRPRRARPAPNDNPHRP